MQGKYANVGYAVLLAAAGVVLGAGCSSQGSTAPPRAVPIVSPASGPVEANAAGETAIVPPASGRISTAQVRSYVLSHRIPQALEASGIVIKSISFLPSEQVPVLLHTAPIDVPAEQPTCLVLMTGTFVFAGPPGQTPTFPVGVEVFNANTGNLLQAGGLPTLPATG